MGVAVKEIVIAHHQRSLAWTADLRGFARTTIYSKGPQPPAGAVRLPNVGIDTHTHLHHICERYDTLPDVTVFCQDHPFDHCPDFLAIANEPTFDAMQARYTSTAAIPAPRADGFFGAGEFRVIRPALVWYDPLVRDDPVRLETHRRKYRLIGRVWTELFPGRPFPNAFPSFWGSQLVLTRERIRSRPLGAYRRLRDLHAQQPLLPHALENLWWFLFRDDPPPGS